MKLRYTLPALADLNSILDYIAVNSPRGANRVQKRVQKSIDLLLAHPYSGLRTEDPTIRRLSTPPYPYYVFYEVADEEITIHAIRHAARNPSGMPGSTSPDPT